MLTPIARRSALAGLAACVAGRVAKGAAFRPSRSGDAIRGRPSRRTHGPLGRSDRAAAGPGSAAAGGPLRENVGGADGVTGANQFEARAIPDGSTALLVPGSATLAWLCGDGRVKFDAGHWVPVWAGTAAAALATRGRLAPGQPLRFAVQSIVGPELAALLALDLLGVPVSPISIGPETPGAAMRSDINAVFLRGPALRSQAEALTSAGWTLAFGLGTMAPDGAVVRGPVFPDLPTPKS